MRKAVRSKLGVPSYAISDAEIASLCSMLDTDESGAVSVAEVVEFVSVGVNVVKGGQQLPAISGAAQNSNSDN